MNLLPFCHFDDFAGGSWADLFIIFKSTRIGKRSGVKNEEASKVMVPAGTLSVGEMELLGSGVSILRRI